MADVSERTDWLIDAGAPGFADCLRIFRSPRMLALEAGRDLRACVEQGLAGDWRALEAELTATGHRLAESQTPLAAWHERAAASTATFFDVMVEELAAEPRRLAAALREGQRLVSRAVGIVSAAYAEARSERLREGGADSGAAPLGPGAAPLARLFESGIIGILICDVLGNIKEANESFLKMVGYSRGELLSGQVRWAEMTPPEYRSLDEDAIEQLKARGVTRPWEKEYLRKDGSRVPILVGVAMLGETDCIAYVLDISERRRLQELRERSADLEAQNRRIQESNRLKSEFLANMSHELRTPLNSIIGFAEVLQEGEIKPDSPQHAEFISYILNGGRHLLQLINDVLDLAKVEAGKLEFRPKEVALPTLATEIVAVLRNQIALKNLDVTIEVEPEVTRVTVDPSRLKQVLYNYLSNALKFTGDGGKIALRLRAEGADMFRVEVEDSGIGIAPEDVGRLFVEFQQLDPGTGKKHAGTGLGLALTKRIVEAQGGSVGVQSVLGAGSLFFANLPRHAEADPQGDPVPPLVERTGAVSVLVIEDDSRDRALLVQTMHKAGYNVQVAENGAHAIASCAERLFHAITLDLLLPDMTGLDVLHQVRLSGKNRGTPVIVVSVVADRGIVGGFSVHDYLGKPINGKELIGSLQRAGVYPYDDGSILVVDDDAAALRLMETCLRRLGFDAICRLDGEAALEAVRDRPPLAVIVDLLMPGMDGFGFLARFRQIPTNRRIPVIIWTMKDLTDEDHVRLRDLAAAVVVKQNDEPTKLVEELRLLLTTNRPG